MRQALILSIAVTALAGAAQAQNAAPARPADGQAAGLRYLSWAGKPATTAPAPSSASPLRPATARTAPPRIIPHAGTAATPSPAPAPRGLTPANAWMRPAAPSPVAAAPPPAPSAGSAPPPAPVSAQPATNAPADPMAPRRDAPIFRMGHSDAAPVSAASAAPVQQAAVSGAPARYYSLHRQNGRQPDPIAMPAPVYLDALPVELERAPASEDLAEPPAAPTLLRDANGRVRPAPQISDDVQ